MARTVGHGVTVVVGDCVEGMRELEPCSVDAVVCDPPYGLEFMGKEWDRLQPDVGGRDDLRGSLKAERDPGGDFGKRIGIAYGAPNKNPRCRNCYKLKHDHEKGRCKCKRPDWDLRKAEYGYAMQWWHQAWATEALRVLKPGGHLLAFGGTRTYHRLAAGIEDAGFEIRDCLCWMYGSGFPKSLNLDGDWDGWGTALKPAYEPIVLARKPLAGTVAGNVLEHGTGALDIDGCRIEGAKGDGNWAGSSGERPEDILEGGWAEQRTAPNNLGRWPANVVLDEHAATMLDQQTGELGMSTGTRQSVFGYGMQMPANGQQVGFGDSGGASRFYYVAKASRAERNAGLDGFDAIHRVNGNKWTDQDYLVARGERPPSAESGPRKNVHPTVKPVALMRWLTRLITPPNGLVLDPFTGSGTTGIAAHLEGLRFIGYERDPDYAKIAEARIAYWQQHGHDTLRIVAEHEQAERARAELEAAGQLTLEGTA